MPTLAELFRTLFGRDFSDLHTANADCAACRYCFLGLLELRILTP